jgi:hypothetical protein
MGHHVRPAILLAFLCVNASLLSADPPPPTPELSEKALEAKWASIGDIGPFYPVQEATGGGHASEMQLGIPPHIDGEKVNSWAQVIPDYTPIEEEEYEHLPTQFVPSGTSKGTKLPFYPVFRDFANTYMAATVQAIYGPNFTSQPGRREFSGAAFTSVFAVPLEQATGVQQTKDVVGYQTILHKSQPSTDTTPFGGFNAVHATTNLSVREREGETNDWRMRRWFVDLLCGGLSEARLAAPQASGADGRILVGDNHQSLSVKFMLGCTSLIHYAAPTVPKDAEFYVSPHNGSTPSLGDFADMPGLMEKNRKTRYARAPVLGIELFKWILNSYLHVGQARGATARLDLSGELGIASPSAAARRIGHWKGLQYSAHSTSPTDVGSSDVGLKVEDQTIEASSQTAFDHRYSVVVPDHVSVMSSGVHVLGDGTADLIKSGYATDAVHVRDVIRIPILSEAPLTRNTELGTIVYAKTIAAGSATYAPGLYVCLLDSGGLKTWRRLTYDLTEGNASAIAGRIYRSSGVQAPIAPNDSMLEILNNIDVMARASNLSTQIRMSARIEVIGGRRQVLVHVTGPVVATGYTNVQETSLGYELAIAKTSASFDEKELDVSFDVLERLPAGWVPRTMSDIRNGVPPKMIRFEVVEEGTASRVVRFLEVDLD